MRAAAGVLLAALLGGALWLALREEGPDSHALPDTGRASPEAPAEHGAPQLQGNPRAPRERAPAHPEPVHELEGVTSVAVPFEGRVEAPDGTPAGGAVVVLSRAEGTLEIQTDREGRFDTDVPAGVYDIVAMKDGVGGLHQRAQRLDGESGQGRTIRLAALGDFALRFHDGQKGWANLPMTLTLRTPSSSPRLTFRGTSDAEGAITISGAPVGVCDVQTVVRPGWIQHRQGWSVRTDARPAPTPIPFGDGGVLRGTVREAQTGRPIGGARLKVIVSAIGSRTWLESHTVSKPDGTYAFEPVVGSVAWLYVAAEGYAHWPNQQRDLHAFHKDLPTTPIGPPFGRAQLAGDLNITFDIPLRRGNRVEGIVRTPNGDPVADVALRLRPGQPMSRDLGEQHEVVAGADGRFAFDHLRDTGYRLELVDASYHLTRAVPVDLSLRVGAEGRPLVKVEVVRGRALRGTVRDTAGRPVFGARVWIENAADAPHVSLRPPVALETYSARDGTWALPSVPPHDDLQITGARGALVSSPLMHRPQVDAPVELVIGATGEVKGRVSSDGTPIGWRATVRLVALDNAATQSVRTQRVDEHGAFTIDRLAPGRWLAVAYTESRITERPVVLEVRAREATSWHAQVIAETTVEGTVVDDQGLPLRDVDVRLEGRYRVATERRWVQVRETVQTDAEGRFTFEGVTAGRYVLRATAASHTSAQTRRLFGNEKDLRLVLPRR